MVLEGILLLEEKNYHQYYPAINAVTYNSNLPAIYTGSISGPNVMGVTKHSLFEGSLHEIEPMPYNTKVANNLRLERSWILWENLLLLFC